MNMLMMYLQLLPIMLVQWGELELELEQEHQVDEILCEIWLVGMEHTLVQKHIGRSWNIHRNNIIHILIHQGKDNLYLAVLQTNKSSWTVSCCIRKLAKDLSLGMILKVKVFISKECSKQ